MSEPPLVRVEHVSKKFCRSLKRSLWYGLQDFGAELRGQSGEGRLALRKDEFLAVDDVSFELRRGECLGLIGANGAGKSTLLKMLNGLVRPDAGKIEMRGRVGALIELGAGFNPILTGRENVYVNGAVLGLTKKEIDARFDDIVEFAELGDFIDSPVQNYSSGMAVRLGFAVAAHLEPDVLLLDEILAVGDLGFRAKCLAFVSRLRRSASVLLVSHDLRMVARLCDQVLYLTRGNARFKGAPEVAISRMRMDHNASFADERIESEHVRILNVRLVAADREIGSGAPVEVAIEFECHAVVCGAVFNLALSRSDGVHCLGVLSPTARDFLPGRHHVAVRFPGLSLSPGDYAWSAYIWGSDRVHPHAAWINALTMKVTGDEGTQGVIVPQTIWTGT